MTEETNVTTDLVVAPDVDAIEIQRQSASLQRRGPFDAVFDSGDWRSIRQVCATIARSNMVPVDCRAKGPSDLDRAIDTILTRVQYGKELGFGVMQSTQNIADINGRPGVFGDAGLALVYGSGLLEAYHEELDESTMIATAKAKRRGIADPYVVSFSQADAETAKLWGKQGPWTQYPKRMLVFRARTWCLRNGFADVLKGIGFVEELQDIPNDGVGFTGFQQGQGERNAYRQMQGEISNAIKSARTIDQLDASVMGAAALPSDMQDVLRKQYRQAKEAILAVDAKAKNSQKTENARREIANRDLLIDELRTVFGEVMEADASVEEWFREVFEKSIDQATDDELRGAIIDLVEIGNTP
jgi:hypothetical protein